MAAIANIIGILGVILMLLAYGLLQCDKLTSSQLSYSVLNLFGALMVLYSLFFAWNLPAAIIESAWAIISLVGIGRVMCAKK